MFKKICRVIKQKYRYYYVKKNFIISKAPIKYEKKSEVMNFQKFTNSFIYKDESWNYIKELKKYLNSLYNNKKEIIYDNECINKKYKLKNNEILIDEQSENNWICFFIKDNKYKNFEITYDIEIESDFEEIQIAFNYKDLGNRCRFMIRNNSSAAFECVYKGKFYNNIYTKNIKLDYKKNYEIKLVVKGKKYMYSINGNKILTIKALKKIVDGKDILLLFYNKTNKKPVKCKIKNFALNEIK